MKCGKYQKLISDWLDGNIRGKDLSGLEEHLKFCKTCQKYYNEQKLIHQYLNNYKENYKEPDLGPDYWSIFEQKLNARLEQEGKKPWKKRLWSFWPMPAWATGLLGIMVIVSAIYLFIPKPVGESLAQTPLSYEDLYLNLDQMMAGDEIVAKNFNEELIKSLDQEIKVELTEEVNPEIYNFLPESSEDNSKNNLPSENMGALEVQL
ncbi:MAG: anti-sigma factor family protein [Candidatus Saccharicenans sp.]|nr:MAG: hypothetical protein C0168_06805 [Candidatus Aminicenantes bacterium]HEK84959.1 zf-HC2 domain-containing protein [Candidatus Aminicenantes bacterium]